MEGKGVKSLIMCVLLLGLVLEQTQVVEAKSCCPSTTARNIYNGCRYFTKKTREECAKLSGCKIVKEDTCTPPFDHFTLHLDIEESDALDFCKLGCSSSVCSNIYTFVSRAEMNDGMERCNDACNRLCTKEADTLTVAA